MSLVERNLWVDDADIFRYMGMKSNSSAATRQRAKDLAAAIGAYHLDLYVHILFLLINREQTSPTKTNGAGGKLEFVETRALPHGYDFTPRLL